MGKPRSRMLSAKPKAEEWITKNSKEASLFLEIVSKLKDAYCADMDGYIDRSPPEYRFNNEKIGGYTFVTQRNHGVVEVRFREANKKFFLTNIIEFKNIKEYISLNKIKNFDFDTQQLDESKETSGPLRIEDHERLFQEKIRESFLGSVQERLNRLRSANKKPKKVTKINTIFDRNPDVVAQVLHRAKGHCEQCDAKAPFIRASDGTPYLEVHHIVRLADGGDDTVENAMALCPNCHREKHYG